MNSLVLCETGWREANWREPWEAAAALAGRPGLMAFLSDGQGAGGWSFVMCEPTARLRLRPGDAPTAAKALSALLGPALPSVQPPAGRAPPFQGGVAGLAAYSLGARLEPAVPQTGDAPWPQLAAGLYPALLAFDHQARRVLALGRGASPALAAAEAARALRWLAAPPRASQALVLAESFAADAPASAYAEQVRRVKAAIARGDLFQTNIARRWQGRLVKGATPADLLQRLQTQSPAPHAGFFQDGELAVVSNSPECFLAVDAGGQVQTRPIKGTRPRGVDAAEDARLAAELLASDKDLAENRMIVDLMRNDLARACAPGSVQVSEFAALERFAHVHHLVSTVQGRLAEHRTALDLFLAAFPPGSVTGAPKVQAMIELARHEPPRGPYCGSLFWAGLDGALQSTVLIRTAALVREGGRWTFEARAGAGITIGSDPDLEAEETLAKIAALARALTEAPRC